MTQNTTAPTDADPQEQRLYEAFKAAAAANDAGAANAYKRVLARLPIGHKEPGYWTREQQKLSKGVYDSARALWNYVRTQPVEQLKILKAANEQLEAGIVKVQKDAEQARQERDAAVKERDAAIAKQQELQAVVNDFAVREKAIETKLTGLENNYGALEKRIGELSGRY